MQNQANEKANFFVFRLNTRPKEKEMFQKASMHQKNLQIVRGNIQRWEKSQENLWGIQKVSKM